MNSFFVEGWFKARFNKCLGLTGALLFIDVFTF